MTYLWRFAHRHYIGDEPLVTLLAFFGQHDCLFHSLMSCEHRFDLSQLDSESPDLHLIVASSEELDVAVRAVACQVSCAIHQCRQIFDKRILLETFGSLFRLSQITSRHSGPRDVQLTGDADRDWLKILVEDVDLGVRDRPSDGNT